MRRGIYVLPALVTVFNFGFGFLSILFSIEDSFVWASRMIIFAMIADALDGAMARATGTESKFGRELDSLADIISFGCAPAILIYQRFDLAAHPYWIFPLFFAVAGALRLARYNVIDSDTGSRDFRGTPIPAPAGIILGLVLALEKFDLRLDKATVILLVFTLSYLMVSNIRYPSSKILLHPEKPRSFRTLILLLLVGILFIWHFVETWLILGALYYLSGPLLGIKNRFFPALPQPEPEDQGDSTNR